MHTTLRTFATTLAAIGMLGIGSLSTMAQDAADQAPGSAPPPEPSAPSDADTSASNERGPASDDAPGSESEGSDASSDTTSERALEDPSLDQATRDSQENQVADESRDQQDDADRQDAMSQDAQDRSQQFTRDDQQSDMRAERGQENDTPPLPDQARQADGNIDRNANWRTTQYNGEWWYYGPNDQWNYHRDGQWHTYQADSFQRMHSDANRGIVQGESWNRGGAQQQPYSTGYRGGQEGYVADQGYAPQLRYDRWGRAYICENGRAVYVQVTSHDDRQRGYNEGRVSTGYRGDEQFDDSRSSGGPPEVPQNPSQQSIDQSMDRQSMDRQPMGIEQGQSADSDADLGRPTPARENMRVAPPAPPEATP